LAINPPVGLAITDVRVVGLYHAILFNSLYYFLFMGMLRYKMFGFFHELSGLYKLVLSIWLRSRFYVSGLLVSFFIVALTDYAVIRRGIAAFC